LPAGGPRGANRSFGFNGHTDVVPVGDAAAWTQDPFGAAVSMAGCMAAATDMKSGVAAFAAAAVDFVRQTPPDGAVILAITGDEEGDAEDGTVALLDWMAGTGERMTHCLVGEPTCPNRHGRDDEDRPPRQPDLLVHCDRGAGPFRLSAPGQKPDERAGGLLARLEAQPLDEGTAHFDASTLAITTIDCGNPATNVIPARGRPR
jgi:succinyl-diaminopimelate desuccinylase